MGQGRLVGSVPEQGGRPTGERSPCRTSTWVMSHQPLVRKRPSLRGPQAKDSICLVFGYKRTSQAKAFIVKKIMQDLNRQASDPPFFIATN